MIDNSNYYIKYNKNKKSFYKARKYAERLGYKLRNISNALEGWKEMGLLFLSNDGDYFVPFSTQDEKRLIDSGVKCILDLTK